MSVQILCLFLMRLFVFLLLSPESFCILNISTLDMCFGNIFSPSVSFLVIFFLMASLETEVFNFDEV